MSQSINICEHGNSDTWLENVGEIILSEGAKFVWMLPALFVKNYDCCVASPYFSFDHEKWRLVKMPHDDILLRKGWISVFLWMKGCHTLEQKYNVRLSAETFEERELSSCHGKFNHFYGFGEQDFIDTDDLSELVHNGLIKICCEITKAEDNPTDSISCSASNENLKNEEDESQRSQSKSSGLDRLAQNFMKLLNDSSNSDVVLKTSDHEFKVHKIVLSASSPVFSSMFQHDMEEKKTGVVDIADCTTAGFHVFLQYLYSGNTDTMSPGNVLDLYYIADKYQVIDLKLDCVEYMKKNLAIYNICDIITLSLKHNESDLLNFATRFFCKNVKKIIKTVQWQNYIVENPLQANELFIKFIDI